MKKYKSKRTFFLLIVNLIFVGCQKSWLDAKPQQNLGVPSTIPDYQALLDDNDMINFEWAPALAEISTNDHYMVDATFEASQNAEKNAYTWSHSRPNTQVVDWNMTYFRTYYANLAIDGLPKIKTSDADLAEWNNVMGQALFIRAMDFFEAAQQFAPPYDSSSASTDLGIPLVLSSNITIPVKRASLAQNYEQIITDLIKARDLLPLNPLYLSRASKPAVYALLSRVYLAVGDYSLSKLYSDSCIAIDNKIIDYNQVDLNSGGNPPVGQYNEEVIFHETLPNYYSFIGANLLVDTTLYNYYDSNDLRKAVFFVDNGDGTHSFQGMYSNSIAYLFGGLATDEIYLNRAECFARAGDLTNAMSDLNTLLVKRWKTGTFNPFVITDADSALSTILLERRKELLLRGIRWSDLRRLNKDPRFAVTIIRTVEGVKYTLQPNSFQYVLPIPDDIISQSGIEQNQGW